MSLGRPPAAVTVSGLSLGATRQEILRKLGQPSFQAGAPDLTHVEYWNNPSKACPILAIDFKPDGTTTRIEGGLPEIDGEDVRSWSLSEVERRLGPADGATSSAAFSSGGTQVDGDAYLRYPDRHLLVRWHPDTGVCFILFVGSR